MFAGLSELIGPATNNLIYQNNFIDNNINGVQVYIKAPFLYSPFANSWDNGSIGNYWSDYLVNFPTARQVWASGVGDTAYVLDSYNLDHYPMMVPLDFVTAPERPDPSPEPTVLQSPSPSPILTSSPSPSLAQQQTILQTPSPSPTPSLAPTEEPNLNPSPSIPEFPLWVIPPLSLQPHFCP
jgi:hypothetical protein